MDTKKRCNRNSRCKRRGGLGHDVEACDSQGSHPAGSHDCPREQEERKILEVQASQKVGRRRAQQTIRGGDEPETQPLGEFLQHILLAKLMKVKKEKLHSGSSKDVCGTALEINQ